jgi:cytidylate kinase
MSSRTANVITIDGPAASGKSSVSRELARRLGWKWLSTGAFYRGLGYVALRESIADDDIPGLVRLARSSVWSVRMEDDQTRVYYGSEDVTREILTEESGSRASKVGQIPEVRQALLEGQRDCASGVPGLVAEGRDCGTVVFPQALLKVYLTASQEERAIRRAREQGLNVEETESQQRERDRQDSNRRTAPLSVPQDAKVLDSNGLNLNQVVERICGWASEAMAQGVKSF